MDPYPCTFRVHELPLTLCTWVYDKLRPYLFLKNNHREQILELLCSIHMCIYKYARKYYLFLLLLLLYNLQKIASSFIFRVIHALH